MACGSKIKTYARIRPFNEFECVDRISEHPVVECDNDRSLVFNPSSLKAIAPAARFATSRGRKNYNQIYEFENVFGTQSSEDEVYHAVALPLLDAAMRGNDASMFAYGATGCGKSHTINAIQDRICQEIFNRKESLGDKLVIRMTYLQLYNEKIIDLLPRVSTGTQYLDMRDSSDGKRQVDVAGLVEYTLSDIEESQKLIQRGNKNRIIAATKANSQSSRSHAVLTWKIELTGADSGIKKASSLSIIDLAGSERAQSTRNRGERLGEGAKINKSLLALGNCITARAQRRSFVPYRESKLTRLLRYSLEGTCETAMIVCVSPSIKHFEETHNTLEYGKRAAAISGSAKAGLRGRRPLRTAELVSQIEKLSLWRQEVTEAFSAHLPDFSTYVEQVGGIASLSGRDFAQAVIGYQSTRELVLQENLENLESISPLKRSLRNVSPFQSRGSILESPQAVKRLHV